MKNNYNIVVHVVNLILLGAIGLLVFFSVVNISPAEDDSTTKVIKFGTIGFLLVLWAVNYWLQYKKQKWIMPIAGTVIYIAIALFIFGVVLPYLYKIVY